MPESDKGPDFNHPATLNDVILVGVWICIVTMLLTSINACHAGVRYRDLRDRLERLEQKVKCQIKN